MNNHEHGETAHELLSLWHVFVALFELQHRIKGLPDIFENIKLANVYQAPGDDDGDDWESHLKDQEQAWIITFLHYLKDGSRVNRKASGGGRWHGRNYQHKTHGKTSWHERKYNLVERTNEQQIANKYTMFEYLPDEDKPKYALCRITIDKRNNAHDRPLSSSQQREGKIIDHGNKGHKGGNFENATGYNNQQFLEGSNPINLADFPESCTFEELYNSLDDHEMAEQNAVVEEPNQLSHNFNANSTVAMDYQNRIEPYPSTRNFATTEGRLDHQEFEQNVQDPYNFNANLTETTENSWYLPFYYAPTVPPITDQGTCNAIEEHQFALCNTQHGQIFESDAYVLEPNNSSYYFKTTSTEPTEKGNHLPIYNQNTIAPGLDTNNNGTTEPEDMDWINITDLLD